MKITRRTDASRIKYFHSENWIELQRAEALWNSFSCIVVLNVSLESCILYTSDSSFVFPRQHARMMMKRNGERRNGSDPCFNWIKLVSVSTIADVQSVARCSKKTLCSDWNSRGMEGKRLVMFYAENSHHEREKRRQRRRRLTAKVTRRLFLVSNENAFVIREYFKCEIFDGYVSARFRLQHSLLMTKQKREKRIKVLQTENGENRRIKTKTFLMYCAISSPLHPSAVCIPNTQCTFVGYIFDPLS